jgi:predicted thioesterase
MIRLMRCRRAWVAAGFLAAAFAMRVSAQTTAPSAAPSADQVKAAYLHKFAGYVDWPPKVFAEPTTPFVIGIVGADSVYTELARLAAGRTVQGRAVEVRHLARAEVGAEVHVIYVGKEVGADATVDIVAAYKGRPVLTVTDLPRAAEAGAALNFIESDKRVRFEATPAVAEQGGLRLSSRLLAVAERVNGAGP